MKVRLSLLIAAYAVIAFGCTKTGPVVVTEKNTMTVTSDVVTESFVGNGPQWGGYDVLNYLIGRNTLSEEDWNTLFERVSFMRPQYMRIMVSRGWNYIVNGVYDPSKSDAVLCRILDYCQKNGVTVQLGEWGHIGGSSVDAEWVDDATSFLKYLVEDKGFNCIRYYTIVNEPNGSWSTVDGSYSLWQTIVKAFYARMTAKGLSGVRIMGPDVAVWSTSETGWVTNAKRNLPDEVQAYDVHAYPTDVFVHSTDFLNLAKAYKAAIPSDRIIMLSEFGFKYGSNSANGIENAARISADGYAADDSQMMTYDSFYAVDVADATIQAMLAGCGGVVYWDLDDAMYNSDAMASKKLKKWGFWNIIGKEAYGRPEDEDIRPWFYTASLLCRYFPSGSEIHNVELPVPVISGLRAVAGFKDGRVTVAIANSSADTCSFSLRMEDGSPLTGIKEYWFNAKSGSLFEGSTDSRGLALPLKENESIDFSSGKALKLRMEARSFVLITNID
jgi:hypothetical protein